MTRDRCSPKPVLQRVAEIAYAELKPHIDAQARAPRQRDDVCHQPPSATSFPRKRAAPDGPRNPHPHPARTPCWNRPGIPRACPLFAAQAGCLEKRANAPPPLSGRRAPEVGAPPSWRRPGPRLAPPARMTTLDRRPPNAQARPGPDVDYADPQDRRRLSVSRRVQRAAGYRCQATTAGLTCSAAPCRGLEASAFPARIGRRRPARENESAAGPSNRARRVLSGSRRSKANRLSRSAGKCRKQAAKGVPSARRVMPRPARADVDLRPAAALPAGRNSPREERRQAGPTVDIVFATLRLTVRHPWRRR